MHFVTAKDLNSQVEIAPPAKKEEAPAQLAHLARQHVHLLHVRHLLLHRPGVPTGPFVKRPPHM